jgi:hypothetical protein
VDPFREWAWRQYDWCARNVPNTDRCRAAWRIHLAAGGIVMVVKTRDVPQPTKPPFMIIAASSMDTAAFAAHFTRRHKGSLADLSELPANMTHEIEQMYRSFHWRLHELRRYKHAHEEEDIEIGVDRAIEALFENHNWGWKQLAGLDGAMVAVFPDGQIATKVNGKVKHHDEIDEATDRLVSVLDS